MKLKQKIIAISTISTLLPVIVVIIVLLFSSKSLINEVTTEIDSIAMQNISDIAIGAYNECRITDEMIRSQLQNSIYFSWDLAKKQGGFGLSSERVTWNAINQETNQETQTELPKMTLGGVWFGQTRDSSIKVILVDEITKLFGGTCTVFQKMNAKGDMLRVATSVIKEDGTRAVGTYIPAVGKDGSPNKIISSILSGKNYFGSAFVVNKNYQTIYEPIKSNSGEIIGMLYVGIAPESVKSLREAIMKKIIGKTGYIYVITGTGARQGYYVISKDGKRDGENIWEAKDQNGNYFIQSVVKKGINSKEQEITFEIYPWKNQGENEARNKIAAIVYYKPFDWVIGASTYIDEYQQTTILVKEQIYSVIYITIIAGLIIIVLMFFFTLYVGKKISEPILNAANAMSLISDGKVRESTNIINNYFNTLQKKKY
jgi:hypothetical protein